MVHGLPQESGLQRKELIAGIISTSELAHKLRIEAEKLAALKDGTVLVLPEISDPDQRELSFHQEAKELLFALRETQIPAQYYEDGREKRSIDLRSADVILPAVMFVGKKVLEGGLEAIGAWIVSKWLTKADVKLPIIKIRFIYMEDGNIQQWTAIEGPADQVVKALRGASEDLRKNNSRKRRKQ